MATGWTRAISAVARGGASAGFLATIAVRISGRTVRWSSAAVAFTPLAGSGLFGLAAWSGLRGERRRALVLAAGAATAVPLVLPRTRRTPQPVVADGRSLRVLSANVFKGRADAAALVALVRANDPDVLAVQEQNPRFLRELEVAGLFELLPHRVVGDGGRMADGSIFSRYPLTATALDLPGEYVGAIIDLPGGQVPFICAHPLPPSSPRYEGPWIRSLEALPRPEGWMAGGVVAGDFNATVDHPQFRALLADGWHDAGSEHGSGLVPTWRDRLILFLTIDHVLAPPGAAITDYRVDDLRDSDHRAITATLTLPPRD